MSTTLFLAYRALYVGYCMNRPKTFYMRVHTQEEDEDDKYLAFFEQVQRIYVRIPDSHAVRVNRVTINAPQSTDIFPDFD